MGRMASLRSTTKRQVAPPESARAHGLHNERDSNLKLESFAAFAARRLAAAAVRA